MVSARHLSLICVHLLVAYLAVFCAPASATLRTMVEPRLVDEMDTIRLTIRQEGSSQSDAPDLTPLMEDFEVLGSQTSSRISSINGRTMASVEYQINLRPRRTGELRIPSVTIDGEQSESVVVRVRPLDPTVKEAIAAMVFFESELSSNPVYVQAETVLTRRLFYSQGVQIYSDLPGVPEIENAVVIPLGETQSLSVLRGSRRYGVIEQRFALFPEQSGSLLIPAISVTSSVRLQSQGRTRRSGIRVSTDEIELEVLPIPDSYPAGTAWLPATGITVDQRWMPNVTDVKVGDPLNFALTIQAKGNRGSAIPPVPLPLPENQFKVYPESPEMVESADTGTVIGTRHERFALIPTAPGPVELPDLSVTWWDTVTNRLRQTRISVSPMLITGTATPTTPVPETEAPTAPAENATSEQQGTTPIAWRPIAGWGLVTIALLTLLTWLLRAIVPRLTSLVARFPQLDLQPARDRREKLKVLQRATRQKDPVRYRHALADFLTSIYQSTPASAIEQFRAEPDAGPLMADLDRAVYAADGYAVDGESQDGWEVDFSALTILARLKAAERQSSRDEVDLPPLYG